MTNLSTTLRERADETRSDIQELEARLASISKEKAALLGAPTLDVKTLGKLEAEEQRIPLAIESQQTRLVLLDTQVQEALKSEAHERVGAIEQERREIANRINERRTAFLKGVEGLLQLIKEDFPERQRAAELGAEAQYLVEAFGVPWPHTPTAMALNSVDINKLDAEFQKSRWLVHAGSAWKEKTDALIQQRARDERAALSGKRRFVRMSTPPFTMGKSS